MHLQDREDRPTRRQVVWLAVVVLVDLAVLTTVDGPLIAFFVALLIVPLMFLLNADFRVRLIHLEDRLWRRWRGASVFDTGLRAFIVAPFYSYLPFFALVIHAGGAIGRSAQHRLLPRGASPVPRVTDDRGSSQHPVAIAPRTRRSRVGLVLAGYGLLYVIVFSSFWTRVGTDPGAALESPALTGTNLLLQVLLLVPAFYVRDAAYRARLAGSFAWIRQQWRATPVIVRFVLLAIFVLSGGIFIVALTTPGVVLVKHLRGATDLPASDARDPRDPAVGGETTEVEGPSSFDVTLQRSQDSADEHETAPGVVPEIGPPAEPQRRAWGAAGGSDDARGGSVGRVDHI